MPRVGLSHLQAPSCRSGPCGPTRMPQQRLGWWRGACSRGARAGIEKGRTALHPLLLLLSLQVTSLPTSTESQCCCSALRIPPLRSTAPTFFEDFQPPLLGSAVRGQGGSSWKVKTQILVLGKCSRAYECIWSRQGGLLLWGRVSRAVSGRDRTSYYRSNPLSLACLLKNAIILCGGLHPLPREARHRN